MLSAQATQRAAVEGARGRRGAMSTNVLRDSGLLPPDGKVLMRDRERDVTMQMNEGPASKRRRSPMSDRERSSPGPSGSHRGAVASSSRSARGSRSGPSSSRPSAAKQSYKSHITGDRPSSVSSSARHLQSLKDLGALLTSRWNFEAKYINLDDLASDTQFKAISKGNGDKGGKLTVPLCSGLMKLISVNYPTIQTLSLAKNDIRDPKVLSAIYHYLPGLVNLNLGDNLIHSVSDLDTIAESKNRMKNLKELIVVRNPLTTHKTYKTEIVKRFPSLTVLDMEPTASIPPFVADITTFPFSIAASSADPAIFGLVSAFLGKFFDTFDNSRPQLLNAYIPNATFSFAINTTIPPRAKAMKFHYESEQRNLKWSSLIDLGSRNLKVLKPSRPTITGQQKQDNKSDKYLYTTQATILEALGKYPKTSHPLTDPEKFIFDAFEINGVIMVVVHGQYAEAPSNGHRSFDRTFLLAPVPAGSPAQAAGWPAVIVSDELTLRNYSPPTLWQVGNLPVHGSVPAPAASQSSTSQSIEATQLQLMQQLSQATRLNAEYSRQCLSGNNWDLNLAIKNFEELKSSIPAEAYI